MSPDTDGQTGGGRRWRQGAHRVDRLVAGLRQRGIHFIGPTPEDGVAGPRDDRELLRQLATSADPLLREALIPLFLLHPGLAREVQPTAAELAEPAATRLKVYYMAAAYLQRLWRTRLELYLGVMEPLPDLFSRELQLPAPEDGFGKPGLHALAALHARHSGYPVNHLAAYQKMLDLLVAQLKLAKAARAKGVRPIRQAET